MWRSSWARGLEARDDVRLRCPALVADNGAWRLASGGAGAGAGPRPVRARSGGARGELLWSRSRWVLDSSCVAAARRPESCGRLGEHRSESARAAREADRLDALKLVMMLVRVWQGETRVWSEVRVPTVADEAARQVSRERTALTRIRRGSSIRCAAGSRRGARHCRRGATSAGGPTCAIGRARPSRRRCKRGWSMREQGISRAGTRGCRRSYSIGVELGAMATAECADPMVSGELWTGQTRAADWHRRGGAQIGDRAVAVCHDGRGPGGRDCESRVGSGRRAHARCGRFLMVGLARPPRRRPQLSCPD